MPLIKAVPPKINPKLNMFEPTTFPIEIVSLPINAALIVTANSGADVPIATTVSPITKSEILNGLQGNGYLIINRDFKYYDKFITYTNKFNNINIVTYGANKKADIYLSKRVIKKKGQKISALAYGKNYDYKINFDGIHQAVNSLAILASLLVLKCDVSKGLKNLSK